MAHYYMEDLMLQSQRVSGTKRPITIIDPHKYESFFKRLQEATGLTLELKTFVAIALTGGLRVTEALSLQRSDFDLEQGFFKVRVLKKNKTVQGKNGPLKTHQVYREAKLHTIASELLNAYLAQHSVPNYSYVFEVLNRKSIDRWLKESFGPHFCAHSLRHSHLSWLLQEKKVPEATVTSLIKIAPNVISSYNHVNARKALNDVYEGESNG